MSAPRVLRLHRPASVNRHAGRFGCDPFRRLNHLNEIVAGGNGRLRHRQRLRQRDRRRSGADDIDAGSGNDTIVGFVGADTVDGGDGTDTITLAATSADLNAATDGDIVNVEAVSAARAAAGGRHRPAPAERRLHHHRQRPSRDSITGGAAPTSSRRHGNDTIVGFVGGDKVDGGDDIDTITLAATSTDLNAAADGDIVNVEAVSAALAAAGA